MTAKLTVWFDGGCPLCRQEIALMKKLDRGAIEFVDLTGVTPNCPIATVDALARIHALEDGRLISGAEAFAAIWRAIPLFWPLGMMARNRWVLAVLERAYSGIPARPAKHAADYPAY